MRFIYDPQKSAANYEKHGMGFDDAKRLWDDPNMIMTRSDRFGESRWIAIARLEGTCWTAVFTKRDHAIRIISVRRAQPQEVSRYDKAYTRYVRTGIR